MRREDESRSEKPESESGRPGGGKGRREDVRGSGVYPASGGEAPADAEVRTMAEWGQGERGPEGAEDAGQSEELSFPELAEGAETEEGREGRS